MAFIVLSFFTKNVILGKNLIHTEGMDALRFSWNKMKIHWMTFLIGSLLLSNCTQHPNPIPSKSSPSSLSTFDRLSEDERLKIAIRINPQHWLGYYRLSQHYQEHQQWEEALKSLFQAQEATMALSRPPSKVILRELGNLYQLLGQDEKALAHYNQAIAQLPAVAGENAELYLDRGKLFLKLKRFPRAEADFNNALAQDPRSFETNLLLAFSKIQRQELNQALEFLVKAAGIDPNYAEVWRQISLIRERLGEYTLAVEAMRKAVELNPDNFEFLKSYAFLLEEHGDTSELELVFQAMLHLFPENAWVHAHYGNLAFHLQQYALGTKLLKQAIELRHDYAWAYFRLGALNAEQQQWDQAASFFQDGLKYEAHNLWARKQLGFSLEWQGRSEEAIEHYQYVIDQDVREASDEVIFRRLAQLYWSELHFEQAIEILKKGLRDFPENRELSLQLARFYEALQQLEQAKEIYLDMMEHFSDNSELLSHLGFLEEQLGNLKQSEFYYKKALRMDPQMSTVRQQLIRLQLRSEERSEAEPELQRFLKNNPTDEWGYAQLSLLKLQQKKEKESLKILKTGLFHNPQSSRLYEILGLTYEKLGEWGQALAAFEKTTRLSSDSAFLSAHRGVVLSELSQQQQARKALLNALLHSDMELSTFYHYMLLENTNSQQKWFGAALDEIRPVLKQILLHQNRDLLPVIASAPLDPTTEEILKIVWQLTMGQRREAKKHVETLLEELDESEYLPPWVLFQIGYVYELGDNYQDAENYYLRVQQQIPEFSWIQARLARIFEKQGNFEKSVAHYADFVRHFEEPLWALSRLAFHLRTIGRDQDSIRIYQKILSFRPQHAESLNNLAWIYLTTGNLKTRKLEQALSYARQAVNLRPSEEYLDTLAEAYFQSGQIDMALDTIKEAIFKTNSQTGQFQYLMQQYRRFRKGDLQSLPDTDVLDISQ